MVLPLETMCEHFFALSAAWLARLAAFRRQKTRVVLWDEEDEGADSLPMTLAAAEIPRVAENPRPCQAPDASQILTLAELVVFRPDLILIANPARHRQIAERLRALGLTPALEVV